MWARRILMNKKLQTIYYLFLLQKRLYTNNPDTIVFGSYATGNIGDRSIGNSIEEHLGKAEQCQIASRYNLIPHTENKILGGGGLIHEYRPFKIARDLRILNKSKKFAVIGIGVGRVEDPNLIKSIESVLGRAELITVRDSYSKSNLMRILGKKVQIYDLACPSLSLNPTNDDKKMYEYGISVRSLPNISQERFLNANATSIYPNSLSVEEIQELYEQNLADIAKKFPEIQHIPFTREDVSFVKNQTGFQTMPFDYNPTNVLRKIESVQKMICMRYHSLAFSILANKPAIAIAYSQKIINLAESAGIPWYRPHEKIKFEFGLPQYRDKLINSSKKNFELLQQALI
jgi:polysaccharide pyruvyl transferase WcaK-like protein